jgi:hypothetical protein
MYVASVAYGSGAVFQKYSTAGNVLWGFSTLTTVQPIGMVCNDSNLYILYSGVGSSSQNLHIVGYSGSTAIGIYKEIKEYQHEIGDEDVEGE